MDNKSGEVELKTVLEFGRLYALRQGEKSGAKKFKNNFKKMVDNINKKVYSHTQEKQRRFGHEVQSAFFVSNVFNPIGMCIRRDAKINLIKEKNDVQ